MPPLTQPIAPVKKAVLRLHTKNSVEDRDRACVVCHVPDINRPGQTVIAPNAAALVPYIINPNVYGRDYTTAEVCRVCKGCLRAIKDRKVGIAGNADAPDGPSIVDARRELPL